MSKYSNYYKNLEIIKSAVKTKLVEIGAYVDDQLSDYVMIMITNKKTEKQMTEDLELFLGGIEQAQNFSAWLHSLIKKTIGKKLNFSINFILSNSMTPLFITYCE